jgi:hypothetical protein
MEKASRLPQAGQYGSPLLSCQRARMNQRYASSSFIAATLEMRRLLASGDSRKCCPLPGSARYLTASVGGRHGGPSGADGRHGVGGDVVRHGDLLSSHASRPGGAAGTWSVRAYYAQPFHAADHARVGIACRSGFSLGSLPTEAVPLDRPSGSCRITQVGLGPGRVLSHCGV